MDIAKFHTLLNQLKNLPEIKSVEPSIFAIGSKGYYENPTTDILAFFCNPQGVHGLGSLVLEALIDCLPKNIHLPNNRMELTTPPEREVRANFEKRIDLLLTGIDWIIIIENKIYHHQNNPFLAYEAYAESNYKEKEKIYIVLSPDGKTLQAGWHGISYSDLLISMKKKLGEYFTSQAFSKWVLLLREFILHLESFMSKPSIPNEHIDFIFDNIESIKQLEELKVKVVSDYQQRIQLALSQKLNCDVSMQLHSWGGKPAMRFFLKGRKNQSGVVLFHREGAKTRFSINFYFIPKKAYYFDEIDNSLSNSSQLEKWEESSGNFRCFREDLETIIFEEVVETIAQRLHQIDQYETSASIN